MGRILYKVGAALALLAAVGSLAGSAGATDAYPTTNDQATTIATARWFYYGLTPSQIGGYINANGARLTQIRVINPATPTFAVTMVKNAGPYASGWYWWYGMTAATLANNLSATNSRLISLEPYQTGGGLRFAAISVPNSGSAARAWWWYYGVSATTLNNLVTANNARLVSLRPYMSGASRVFAAVMVRNTGQDYKPWHWWAGASVTTINSGITANSERLISFATDPAGGFDAIAVSSEGETWYWWYGLTGPTVSSNLVSHGTRLIDVSPYNDGGLKFTAVELDDSNPAQLPGNAESTRVRNYAETHGWAGGWHGGYFLAANASSPALAYNSAFRFEPASAIKVLYLLYTLQHVTPAHLSDPITYYYPFATTNPNACPKPAWEIPADAHTTTIKDALNKMMRNSDNIMTRAFAKKWGLANVQAMASSLGMTSTRLFQAYIGCGFKGGVRNELTLQDAAKLYKAVQNGSALSGSNRTTFFTTLLGGAPSSTDAWGTIVGQEAAALGKSAIAAQFRAAMDVRYKGGSYGFCLTSSSTCNPYKTDLTVAGRILIPFKQSGQIVKRAYLFGDYVNDLVIPCASGSGCSAESAAGNALWKTAAEEARTAIRAALMTW